MKRRAHWTAGYLLARFRQELDRALHPRAPWIPAAARRWLESTLTGKEAGIEWGAGRSTLWLASRLSHLVSVEESPEWHERVRSGLAASKVRNVSLVLAPAKDDDSKSTDTDARERRLRYITANGSVRDGTIDFALVDGCLRSDCCLRAVSLLEPGGILALDDSQRYLPGGELLPGACGSADPDEGWAEFARSVTGWEERHFSDGVGRFSVWRRPVVQPRRSAEDAKGGSRG